MAITIVYQLLSISFDNYLVFYVISGVIETKKKRKKGTREIVSPTTFVARL